MDVNKIKFKNITSIMIIFIILFQIIIPCITPLQSYAETASNEKYMNTPLGRIIIKCNPIKEIKQDDIVPIEIWIDPSISSITNNSVNEVTGWFEYNHNDFFYDLESTESYMEKGTGTTGALKDYSSGIQDDGEGLGYFFDVGTISSVVGENEKFKLMTFYLKARKNLVISDILVKVNYPEIHNTAGTKMESSSGEYNIEYPLPSLTVTTSKLTVDPNGGTWETQTTPQEFTQDSGTTKTISRPTPATGTGYRIQFDANGGTVEYNNGTTIESTPIKQIVQEQQFKEWELTGGGTLSTDGETYTFGDTAGTLTAQYEGKAITLPDAKKPGSTFKGWYTSKTGTDKIGEADQLYTPTSNLNLVAQWDEQTYELTIDPDEGTYNGNTTISGKYDDTVTVKDPTPPNGYTITLNKNDGTASKRDVPQAKTFNGWTKAGKGTFDSSTKIYTFEEGNGTLTATYTANTVDLGEETRTGYDFAGWYTAPTGGTQITTPTAYTPSTNGEQLYAHWTPKQFTITFNPAGGTLDSADRQKTVTYNGEYGTLPRPTKSGYDFDGWYDPSSNKITSTSKVNIERDTELTAVWLGAEYTVTLDPNGGTVTPITVTVRNEGKYGTLPKPTKTGYTFEGWYDASNNKIESTTTVNTTTNITLTAKWQAINTQITINPAGGTWNGSTTTQTDRGDYNTTKEIANPTQAPDGYTVTFNANGGTVTNSTITQTTNFTRWNLTGGGTFVGTTYTYGLTDGTLEAEYERQPITLPEPTKTGTTFKGWFEAPTGGTPVGLVGTSYTPTRNITLYAQWEEQEYTLTINPNGGTYTGQTQIKGVYNSRVENIANPVGPNGYTVILNKNDGTGTTATKVQTQSFNSWTLSGAGSITGATYTFGAGNGTLTATYTANTVDLGEETRTGYDFAGWYTAETGGTQITTPTAYTPSTNGEQLYAHWTPKQFKITFDPGYGTLPEDEKEKTVTYDSTYGELPKPERPGYDFEGWYNPDDNKIISTNKVDITGDTTLTAKWEGKQYTVRFDANGGTVTPTTKTVKNTEAYGDLPTPTKQGYTFQGWQDSSNNIVESTTIVNTTTDMTLTAKWQAINTKLTVDPAGGTLNGVKTPQTHRGDYNTTIDIPNPEKTPDGYTVTFNANGGTVANATKTQTVNFTGWNPTGGGTFAGTTYTYGLTDGKLEATYERQPITLPEPTKTGTTFKGWFETSTGGTAIGQVGDSYTPTRNITLYAQWEEQEYTLTINPNGGTYNAQTQIKGVYNSRVENIANPQGPTGYTITLNKNDGTGATTSKVQTQSFNSWTLSGAGSITGTTYTFGAGDGTLTATYTPDPVNLGEETRLGYDFSGWYTAATGGTQITTPAAYTPSTNGEQLYAHWTPKQFKITFNPENGTLADSEKEKQVTYNETYGDLPTPTRQGYDFEGWYNPDGNKIISTDKVNITQDTTLTARWAGAEYTVTLDPNGGTVSPTTKTVKNTEPYGDLPTPTKTGYTFTGWYDASNNKIESTTRVNITTDITLITLTAHWQAINTQITINPVGGTWNGFTTTQTDRGDYNTTKEIANPEKTPDGYTVTFNANGGTVTNSTITQTTNFIRWNLTGGGTFVGTTYTYGLTDGTLEATYEGQPITLETPTKTGIMFKGWYETPTGGTPIGQAGDSYTPTKDITLYAQWEEEEYTLTIDANGGTYNGAEQIQGVYNSTTGDIETPTGPKGNTIILDKNDGTTRKIEQTQSFEKWEIVTGDGNVTGSKYTFGKENATLKAIYKLDSVDLGEETKQGYTFNGWYTQKTGGTKIETPTAYTPTSNETLYAQWTANEYKITFNPGDGTLEEDKKEKTVTYDEPYGELPTPKRERYTFTGWYDPSDNKIESTTIVNITSNTTLTAKWEEEPQSKVLFLESEKYKVGEKNIDKWEDGDVYLDKIEPDTTVAKLKENCDYYETLKVITLDKEGKEKELKDDEFIGTGMTIIVEAEGNDKKIELKAVVMDDLDGDGHVTPTDLSTMKHVLQGEVKLEGAEFLAADLDDTKEITPTDLSTINQVILEVIKLTYTKDTNQQ